MNENINANEITETAETAEMTEENKENAIIRTDTELRSVNAVTEYELENGAEIKLSPDIVRRTLTSNPNITDQEIMMFIELCKYQKINPFLKEAYLIKYGDSPANIVCGKELFTKRAERHPDFDGYEAGIIVLNSEQKMQNRPGTTYMPEYGDKLIGGWAKIYRKSRRIPLEMTAMYNENAQSGPTWKKMPALMIRKVALVQALREAFPEMYGGLYSQEEIEKEEIPNASGTETSAKSAEHYCQKSYENRRNYMQNSGGLNTDVITEKQIKLLCGKVTEYTEQFNLSKEEKKELVSELIALFGYDSVNKVLKKDFDEILKKLQNDTKTLVDNITELSSDKETEQINDPNSDKYEEKTA